MSRWGFGSLDMNVFKKSPWVQTPLLMPKESSNGQLKPLLRWRFWDIRRSGLWEMERPLGIGGFKNFKIRRGSFQPLYPTTGGWKIARHKSIHFRLSFFWHQPQVLHNIASRPRITIHHQFNHEAQRRRRRLPRLSLASCIRPGLQRYVLLILMTSRGKHQAIKHNTDQGTREPRRLLGWSPLAKRSLLGMCLIELDTPSDQQQRRSHRREKTISRSSSSLTYCLFLRLLILRWLSRRQEKQHGEVW